MRVYFSSRQIATCMIPTRVGLSPKKYILVTTIQLLKNYLAEAIEIYECGRLSVGSPGTLTMNNTHGVLLGDLMQS